MPPQGDDKTFEKAPTSDRPGKFEFLWDFAQVGSEDSSLRKGYKKLEAIGAIPGLIVHVLDESPENLRDRSRRLDRRVMLILRESNMSFMCFTFCWHDAPQSPQTHWRVCEEGNRQARADTTNPKLLEVILQPHGLSDDPAAQRFPPKDGITINIDDPWNVEKEVFVKVLGRVAPSALPGLAKAVKDLFCQNVDDAIPPPGSPLRRSEHRSLDREEVRIPERSNSRRKSSSGSHYVSYGRPKIVKDSK